MRRLVQSAVAAAFVMGITAIPHSTFVRVASAQDYTPETGYELAWSIDPRDYPELFTHTSGIGGYSVFTGMDFDQDGKLEILMATDETLPPRGDDPGFLEMFLFENDGDNSYTNIWHWSYSDSSNSFPPIAIGDIDEDGLQEIYFGVPTLPRKGDPNDLFVFEQNEDLTFPDTPTTTWGYNRDISTDFRPSGLQLADVDGDGKIELITVSRTAGNRELVVASLAGALDEFASWNIEFEAGNDILGGGSLYDVGVADFDNDGNMEIWVNTWDLFSLAIFEASGADTYSLQAEINQYVPVGDAGGFNIHDFLFEDIDGDSRLELLYPQTDGVFYFLDDVDDVSTISGDSFARVGKFAPTSGNARGADSGDIDGDGNIDLVVSTGVDETVMRIEYDGVGDPADSTSYVWSTILDTSDDTLGERYYPLRIADEDLDGDNKREIVLTNLYASDPGQLMLLVLEASGSTAVDPISTVVPERLALKANYPNPFKGATTIEYDVDRAGTATITVYNLMGQAVRTLVDESHQPGSYRTSWDGTNDAGQRVSSGTYLYAIEADGARQTRRMVYMR